MPADASIYGMLQQPKPMAGPMDQFGQVLQMKHLMGQGQLQDLQRGELERGIDEERRIRDLFARGNVKPEDVMAISPKRGLEFQKSHLEGQKSEAELAKTRAEVFAKNMSIVRDLAAQASDDNGMRAVKEVTLRLFGPEQAARIPDRFDPETQKRLVMTADQLVERLSPKLNMTDTGGAVQPTNPYTGAPQGTPLPKTAAPQQPQGATWDSERGVWVQPPQRGTLPPGSATPSPTNLPPRVGDVASLRKEFNDLPEVKNYRSVVPIFNSAINAPDTRAGDIQFAYTIGKIFDPNSVVREGELKLVGEAATVLEKFQGELRTLTEGKGRLTPQTRRELLATAQARVKELESAQLAARKTYEGQATSRGLPLEQIFIDMPKLGEIPAPPPAPPQFTQEQIDTELRRRGVIR